MSTCIIAECGINHNGSLEVARRLIDAAAAAGADAVKFQAYDADQLALKSNPLYAVCRQCQLSEDDFILLSEYAGQVGIPFFASSFDITTTDMLDQLNVPWFKVPSGEILSLDYLDHMARLGRPILLSTGMSSLSEITAAVRTIEHAGNRQLTLLHCVSAYPAQAQDYNLRVLDTLRAYFGYPVGLSDHTMGLEVSLAAIALGAVMIERHLTLDRNAAGPDHAASLEPHQFSQLVQSVRIVESALGDGCKRVVEAEKGTAKIARRGPSGKRE